MRVAASYFDHDLWLASGLKTEVTLRAYTFEDGRTEPIALAVRRCTAQSLVRDVSARAARSDTSIHAGDPLFETLPALLVPQPPTGVGASIQTRRSLRARAVERTPR
jgi:hypothetical protein